jgi:RimJ/RimL family protein N-acetyltransferase
MSAPSIPDATLAVLAKALHSQGRAYGFQFTDYVRLASVLLDVAMEAQHNERVVEPTGAMLPLRGDNMEIRASTEADRPLLERWLREREGRWFLLSRTTKQPLGLGEVLDDPDNLIGMIVHGGRTVGAMGFLQIDRRQRRAELRKLIGEPDLRGHGLGSEATRLWVAYGFGRLGLRKVFLYTLASNQANVRLNEQVGFRVEGVLRNEVRIDGVDHDLLRMALARADGTPRPAPVR